MKATYAEKLAQEGTHKLIQTVDFSSQVAYAMYLAGVEHGKKNLDIGKEIYISRLDYPTEPLLQDYEKISLSFTEEQKPIKTKQRHQSQKNQTYRDIFMPLWTISQEQSPFIKRVSISLMMKNLISFRK